MGGAQPEQGSETRWRVPLAGAVTLVAFVTALLTLEAAPGAPATSSLPDQATALASRLEREIADAVALAGTVRARLRADEALNWKDFDALVSGSPLRSPAQSLVAFGPRVRADARESFEADTGRDGFRSFRIFDAAAETARPGVMGAGRRGTTPGLHHPIALTVPLVPASDLLGLDLGAAPGFDAAMGRLDRGEKVAIVGPSRLLPLSVCAGETRLGCQPSVFVIVSTDDSPRPAGRAAVANSDEGRRPGFVVVALSWANVAQAATLSLQASHTSPSFTLPDRRPARATFRVQDETWSLELRLPARHPHAGGAIVSFDPLAQATRR